MGAKTLESEGKGATDLSFRDQGDAAGRELDEAFFVEIPDGLFEGFFARSESLADRFRRALVSDRDAAAVFPKELQDAVREIGDAAVADRFELEIDFVILADGPHVALQFVAG